MGQNSHGPVWTALPSTCTSLARRPTDSLSQVSGGRRGAVEWGWGECCFPVCSDCMQGREEKPESCCLKQSNSKHHKNKNADFGGGDQCLSNLLCGTQGLLSKGRKIPQGLGWGGVVREDTVLVPGCSFSAIYRPSLELQGPGQKIRQFPGDAHPWRRWHPRSG